MRVLLSILLTAGILIGVYFFFVKEENPEQAKNYEKVIEGLQRKNDSLKIIIDSSSKKIEVYKAKIDSLEIEYREEQDKIDSLKSVHHENLNRINNYTVDSFVEYFSDRYSRSSGN